MRADIDSKALWKYREWLKDAIKQYESMPPDYDNPINGLIMAYNALMEIRTHMESP